MTEQQQLLAAIIAEPDCDTLRLAYADWLDEHGEADRAEFIRLQVELERLPDCQFKEYQSEDRCDQTARAWSISCRSCVARGRQKALINAHPEWARMKCKSRNPVFRRGLIEQVDCTLAELGEEREVGCRRCKGRGYSDDCRWCGATGTVREFVPSAWAIAVSTAHPVTRFKITDRDLEDHTPPGVYAWYSREHVRSVAFLESASGPPTIPQVFLDAMNGHKDVLCPPTIAKWFTTRDAAVDALAVAAGTLVRNAIVHQSQHEAKSCD